MGQPASFPKLYPLLTFDLHQIWSLDLLSTPEKSSVRRLIFDTARRLRRDSSRTTDLGSRYAQLLELLWQRTLDSVQRSDDVTALDVGASLRDPLHSQQIPALPIRGQEEFSWLDLHSVGDLLAELTEAEMPLDRHWQSSRRGSTAGYEMYWSGLNDTGFLF